ncbi:hypothetical protein [Halocynthiibacter sp.]|uniref:hypothetical protein n=1 Tax=Halocynthiibacter sp. TaxID=1979210 RepID=UPI003C702978
MTYGVIGPKGFGDYFPPGKYVGLQDTIENYYNTQMTASEKKLTGWSNELIFIIFLKNT